MWENNEGGGRMPLVTECDVWVRSTDMDADGVVNNAHYFEFFEQARLEHMIRLGLIRRPRPRGEEGSRSFTIAETTCRYKAPLRHQDWIRVRCWLTGVRNHSFILAYAIVMRDTGALVAEGSSAQVWLDSEGRPAPLPEEARPGLGAAAR